MLSDCPNVIQTSAKNVMWKDWTVFKKCRNITTVTIHKNGQECMYILMYTCSYYNLYEYAYI